MNVLQEAWVVWRQETVRAFFSARFVSLAVLYFLFTLLSGLTVHGCSSLLENETQAQVSQGEGKSEEILSAGVSEGRREVVRRVFAQNDSTFAASLEWMPLPLLFLFELGIYFLPLYITLLGFDQISSEFGPRTLRFFTLRARRGAIVLGRFFSQWTLLWALIFFIVLLQAAFAKFEAPDLTAAHMAELFLRLLLKAWVMSLPYVALSTLCSTVAKTSPMALFLNIIFLFLFWLDAVWTTGLLSYSEGFTHTMADIFQHLSVWTYRGNLLHPSWQPLLSSIAAHVVFAAVFLAGAWLTFERKEV